MACGDCLHVILFIICWTRTRETIHSETIWQIQGADFMGAGRCNMTRFGHQRGIYQVVLYSSSSNNYFKSRRFWWCMPRRWEAIMKHDIWFFSSCHVGPCDGKSPENCVFGEESANIFGNFLRCAQCFIITWLVETAFLSRRLVSSNIILHPGLSWPRMGGNY